MPIFSDPWDLLAFNQQQAQAAPPPSPAQLLQQRQASTPLSKDEEDGLLKNLLGSGLTGLGYVGGVLDKTFGGRAIRSGVHGLLGGEFHPSELLSMLPGSDTIGLTDEKNRVTGEQIAKQAGLLHGEGTKGTLEARDFVGPAIEAALDPAMYLSLGARALTGTGQAAKKLGAVPETLLGRMQGFQSAEDVAKAMGRPLAEARQVASTVGQNIDDLVGKPLGGLANVGLPFGLSEQTTLGTGATAQKVAAKLGGVYDKALYSAPGRYLSAALDPRVKSQTDPLFQKALRAESKADAARSVQRRLSAVNAAEPLFDTPGAIDAAGSGRLRALHETGAFPGPFSPDILDALGESSGRLKQFDAANLARGKDAGLLLNELDSVMGTQHLPRFPTPIPVGSGVREGLPGEAAGREFYAGTGTGRQRKRFLDLEGGTQQLETMLRDTEVAGAGRVPTDVYGQPIRDKATPQALQKIDALFGKLSAGDRQQLAALRQIDPGSLTAADRAALERLSKVDRRVSSQVRKTIGTDVLGEAPGTIFRDKRTLPSELEKMQSFVGPQLPDQADRFAQLSEKARVAEALRQRYYRVRGTPGGFAKPAEEIIPELNKTYQDIASERLLRERYLKPNSGRYSELLDAAKLTPEQATKLVLAKPNERAAALAKLPLSSDESAELMREALKEYQAPRLARYLGGVSQERVGPQGVGLFANDPVMDLLRAGEQIDRGVGRANVATDILTQTAVVGRSAPEGHVPVTRLFKKLGLDRQVAGGKVLDALNASGANLLPADIKKVFVPGDVAERLTALSQKLKAPEYVQKPLGLFDQLTNLTRGHLTASWPAKYVRDLTSSTAQNLQLGAPGAVTFGGPAINELRAGRVPQGLADAIPAFAGLTDAEAARELGKQMFANRIGTRYSGPARELAEGTLPGVKEMIADLVPGVTPRPGLPDILSGQALTPGVPLAERLNPFNMTGWGGRNVTHFAPAEMGRQVGDLVDEVTRGGMYADLLKQGYLPDVAGTATNAAHFDYNALTDFERSVMRRLVPFYSYQRNIIPQQLANLATNPGGLAGQAVRLSDHFRGSGFVPPYLGGGLAIPLGGEDETGNQRYLTKFDLPWEQPAELIAPGPKGGEKTAMRILGQLNPLIKGPLEMATNRQFYSGRELDDLYSRTGIPLADQVIMNSPAARLLTTAGTLADPRKGLAAKAVNLASGVKVSDVDVDRQRRQAAQDVVAEILAGTPNVRKFENFSVRPEAYGQLTPDELNAVRLYKALEKEAAQAAKQRKR
jgi:hypothetical protein